MMYTDTGLMVLVTVIISIVNMTVGYVIGHKSGMIDLASGIYQCELVDNIDRTTQWECQPNEDVE